MLDRADVVVIGAGVVGLAVGRAFARAGRDVIVAEKNGAIGQETSSRNSEVIHAGIQYRPGGARARLAVRGRNALYEFCEHHNVNYSGCGKLLVAASDAEIDRLKALKKTGETNGVDDLQILSGREARALEPELKCAAAILSPSSGIVDSHGLMLALQGDFERAGGLIALSSPVMRGRVLDRQIELETGGDEPFHLSARLVINCAGLYSARVAHSISGLRAGSIPALHYAKGQYFTYSGKAPFSRLIYPLPAPDTQGIHYTRDLGGQAKLGPDINFVSRPDDYDVDIAMRASFASAARSFWPGIDEDRLAPGYAGIRPKIAGPGEEGDFVIQGPAAHGQSCYIGLYGIESPGLTTCLAIADEVLAVAA